MDFKTFSRLNRFKDVVFSLLKYGFDDLVARLDLPWPELRKRFTHIESGISSYERIRLVLEDLGPTFVKFGQIMSLRPDLLPAPLLFELSKLQDQVKPLPFAEIRHVVDKALGRPLEEVFQRFEPESMAGASLSQVHQGVLRETGETVCIKIQRPGIREKMKADLDILEAIAHRLHERSEALRVYDLPNMVRVTRRNLLREIDFHREARNMQIARSYIQDDELYVPDVHGQYCFETLLVMEFIQGTRIKDLASETLPDPAALARQGLQALLKQILLDGFFHADPHPGNILVIEGSRLCLLDWGMAGRLTKNDRDELLALLKSVVDSDSEAMVDSLLRMSTGGRAFVDTRSLEREMLDILDLYAAVPIKEVHIGELLLSITQLLREYRLQLPPDLVIMVKALVTAEGTARQIYPDLDVVTEAKGTVTSLAEREFRPEAIWKMASKSVSRLLFWHREIPSRLFQIVEKLEKGDLTLRLQQDDLAGLQKTLREASSRLTFGIILAGLTIGSSVIIVTDAGPTLFGFPALGIMGYLISGILGLCFALSLFRKG